MLTYLFVAILFLTPFLWWGITVGFPGLLYIRGAKSFWPWVGICLQINAFAFVFSLLIGKPILAFIISPPILGIIVFGTVISNATGMTWLILPTIFAGFVSLVVIFLALKKRHVLPKFQLFIALVASLIIASSVAELIARQAMHRSAQDLGGEIIRMRPVIRVIANSFDGDRSESHAIITLDGKGYHWSYGAKAFVDASGNRP